MTTSAGSWNGIERRSGRGRRRSDYMSFELGLLVGVLVSFLATAVFYYA